jgi:hypothetical protein
MKRTRTVLVLLPVWLVLWFVLALIAKKAHAPAYKPSPYHFKALDGIRVVPMPQTMTPSYKFCNPDYVYGPGEIPQISGKCLPIPISCEASRDFYTPQYDARCPGRI